MAGGDSTPSRSRTCNLRFRRPPDIDANPYDSQGIPHVPPGGSSTGSSNTATATAFTPNADLARLVELWPSLPPAIRAVIVTLANTSAPAPTTPPQSEQDDRLPPGYERSGKTN